MWKFSIDIPGIIGKVLAAMIFAGLMNVSFWPVMGAIILMNITMPITWTWRR